MPQRTSNSNSKSTDRSDYTSDLQTLPQGDSPGQSPPHHSSDLNPTPTPSSSSMQTADVLGRALQAVHRSTYPIGSTDNRIGTNVNRFRVS